MRVLINGLLLLLIAAAVVGAWLYVPDRPVAELAAKYQVEGSRFIDVEGVDAHVAIEGDGPPLMLLHGTASSLHTWDGWATDLADEYRVVRVDLPGFGLTGPHPRRDYSIAAYLSFVEAVADRLGLDSFHLAGNSLGGRIAWSFAAEHGGRVRSLLLIAPSGFPTGRAPSLVFRLASLPAIGDALAKLTPRSLYRRSLGEVYADDDLIDEALVQRYFELSLRDGNRQAFIDRARQADAATGQDPTLRLAEIGAPTLILWGGRDEWIPVEHGRRFEQAIPAATLVVYEDLGHIPMEEAPARTAADAREFLSRRR